MTERYQTNKEKRRKPDQKNMPIKSRTRVHITTSHWEKKFKWKNPQMNRRGN
jgi:hypothetical protein